jgi:short-subunit dehydrogenase
VTTSKGFFDSLRYEVGNDIQITIACPGYVASPFHEKAVGVQQSSQEGSQRQRDYSKYMTMSACAEKIARAEQEGAREVVRWRDDATGHQTSNNESLSVRHRYFPGEIAWRYLRSIVFLTG